MSPDRNRLHIAIQKSGRLSDRSRQLLRDAGLRVSDSGNNPLTARAENFPLDLMLVRDDDIPTFVGDGVCELGIVGQNVLEEYALGQSGARFEEVAKLGFGRCTLKIAAPESLNFFAPSMLAGLRIATSYPKPARPLPRPARDRGRDRHDARRGRACPAARHRALHLRPRLDRRHARGQRPRRGRGRVRQRGGAGAHAEADRRRARRESASRSRPASRA